MQTPILITLGLSAPVLMVLFAVLLNKYRAPQKVPVKVKIHRK